MSYLPYEFLQLRVVLHKHYLASMYPFSISRFIGYCRDSSFTIFHTDNKLLDYLFQIKGYMCNTIDENMEVQM